MRKQIIIFILIISNISFAQIYENWVIRYNGSGNYIDEAKEIVVDQSDNTYVTGYSLNLNLEFDYDVELIEHKILDGKDLNAINTFENPDAVKPRLAEKTENIKAIVLPKCSHNVIRYRVIGG